MSMVIWCQLRFRALNSFHLHFHCDMFGLSHINQEVNGFLLQFRDVLKILLYFMCIGLVEECFGFCNRSKLSIYKSKKNGAIILIFFKFL